MKKTLLFYVFFSSFVVLLPETRTFSNDTILDMLVVGRYSIPSVEDKILRFELPRRAEASGATRKKVRFPGTLVSFAVYLKSLEDKGPVYIPDAAVSAVDDIPSGGLVIGCDYEMGFFYRGEATPRGGATTSRVVAPLRTTRVRA